MKNFLKTEGLSAIKKDSATKLEQYKANTAML
jgi:hypothetical protein